MRKQVLYILNSTVVPGLKTCIDNLYYVQELEMEVDADGKWDQTLFLYVCVCVCSPEIYHKRFRSLQNL